MLRRKKQRTRRALIYSKNPKHLLQHKPLLARSVRDRRRTGSSEGRQHGVPSKPSSLIREGDGLSIRFEMYFRVSVSFFFFFVFFCFLLVCKMFLACQAGTKGEKNFRRMGCVHQIDEAGHGHLEFCVNEGYILHHVSDCPSYDKYCCFAMLAALL